MKEHPHSIVLIKDTFHSNDNRFLLYYDARWDCRLFLNYATVTSDFELDQKNIAKHLQYVASYLSENHWYRLRKDYKFNMNKMNKEYPILSNWKFVFHEMYSFDHKYYNGLIN